MPPTLYKNINSNDSVIKIVLGIDSQSLLAKEPFNFFYDFTFNKVLCNVENKFYCSDDNLCSLKNDGNFNKNFLIEIIIMNWIIFTLICMYFTDCFQYDMVLLETKKKQDLKLIQNQ